MRPALECIPCLLRQTLEAVRLASPDPVLHEQVIREVLSWLQDADLRRSPPAIAQRVHRRVREVTGVQDPYTVAKDRQNAMATSLLSGLEAEVAAAPDPFDIAVRLAIAGNVIDLGVNGDLTDADVRRSAGSCSRSSARWWRHWSVAQWGRTS